MQIDSERNSGDMTSPFEFDLPSETKLSQNPENHFKNDEMKVPKVLCIRLIIFS